MTCGIVGEYVRACYVGAMCACVCYVRVRYVRTNCATLIWSKKRIKIDGSSGGA